MPIYAFEGREPSVAPTAWIAPSADVIGDVRVGPECYVGWGAIVRGDHGTIDIQEGAAVEEGVIIHTSEGFVCRIGEHATIGHGAMLHDATVEAYAVVGVRATLSNRSILGRWAILGEMGLLREGQHIPPESIAVGAPARVIGRLEERHKERWLDGKARYRAFTRRNPVGLTKVE